MPKIKKISPKDFAKALVDPTIQDNPYPVYEAVRASGPDIGGRSYNPATISYAATRQMLRSRDFGVGGGHAREGCGNHDCGS